MRSPCQTPRSCYRGNFVEAATKTKAAASKREGLGLVTEATSLRLLPISNKSGGAPTGLGLVTEATSLRRTSEICSDVVDFPQGDVNSDGDDLDQIVQADEIIRVSCD